VPGAVTLPASAGSPAAGSIAGWLPLRLRPLLRFPHEEKFVVRSTSLTQAVHGDREGRALAGPRRRRAGAVLSLRISLFVEIRQL